MFWLVWWFQRRVIIFILIKPSSESLCRWGIISGSKSYRQNTLPWHNRATQCRDPAFRPVRFSCCTQTHALSQSSRVRSLTLPYYFCPLYELWFSEALKVAFIFGTSLFKHYSLHYYSLLYVVVHGNTWRTFCLHLYLLALKITVIKCAYSTTVSIRMVLQTCRIYAEVH